MTVKKNEVAVDAADLKRVLDAIDRTNDWHIDSRLAISASRLVNVYQDWEKSQLVEPKNPPAAVKDKKGHVWVRNFEGDWRNITNGAGTSWNMIDVAEVVDEGRANLKPPIPPTPSF